MTIDDWRARYDGLNAETDRLRAEVERLRADTINVHLKRAMLVVQRDAAKAGEARAVEALRKLANEADALQIEEYSIRELVGNTNWSCLRLRIDEARALDAQPALGWLTQQRAEAAAGALDEAAEHCETTELLMPVPKPGTTLREHGANVCVAMAGELRQRAAAPPRFGRGRWGMNDHAKRLREMVDDLACFGLDAEGAAALLAGAEALERMEAMESTGSAMLGRLNDERAEH